LQGKYIGMAFTVKSIMTAKTIIISHQYFEIDAFSVIDQIVSQKGKQRVGFFPVNHASVEGQFTVFVNITVAI
jgi:hypothetical protein